MPQGIRQVIIQKAYAKALYPTALLDTDYQSIDAEVYNTMVDIFGMPYTSSATYLRKELRIWPSILYAHRRALRLSWKLAHAYWTADVFKQWASQAKGSPLSLTWVRGGVLSRLTKILLRYKLKWEDVIQVSTWQE